MINLQLCFPRSLLVGFVLLTQVNQSCVFPSSAQASIWELIVQSFAGGESGAERTSREVEGLLAQVAKVESLKIDRLYPETPNTVPDWQPLPGMKRLDQRRVHRFLSPDRPETTIQFPRRELTNPSCFHLSTDGRRFYLVQKGRLETWDTQTGKLVDSVKCRMDKPIGIIVSDDQSQIWIFDQVELLSNSEGASKTCEKLSLPHIQKIVRSAQANIFIAVQNDGNLLFLNLENRAILKLDGPPTLDGRVAISPDGKRLLSVCPEGLVTWYIDEPAKAIVTMNLSTDVEANTQTPAAGNTIFAWSSPHAIHAYESGKYLALWKDEKFPSYWNVLQSHIFIGRDEGGYEWPVVVGTHVAADNRLQRVLIDCNLRQGRVYSSSPLFLCDTPIERT